MDSLFPLAQDGNTPQKKCTGPCGRMLPATPEFFHVDRSRRDGLRARCKQCYKDAEKTEKREAARQLKKEKRKSPAQRDKENARARAKYHERGDEARKLKREYYVANREQMKEKRKRYNDKTVEQRKIKYEANREQRQAYMKQYYHTNQDRVKAYREANRERTKAYNEAHKEHRRELRAAHREHEPTGKHGVTRAQKRVMAEAVAYRCEICEKHVENLRNLHVDHSHHNGQVRGLLCAKCNYLLGNANDDPFTLQKAIGYLHKYHGESEEL